MLQLSKDGTLLEPLSPEPDKRVDTGTSQFMTGVKESDFDGDDMYVNFQFLQHLVTAIIDSNKTTRILHHQNKTNVPQNWILLNNQSTVDVFSKKRLLKNV
jgi:hypothetical protein